MTRFGNSNRYFSFHGVISYPSKWTLNLTYDVLMRSFLTILEGQSIKFHKSIGIICLRLKNFSVWICWSIAWVYQLKAKFTSIQLTTCKSLTEVKLYSDWGYNMVVEDSVICICCFTTWWSHFSLSTQKTCCSIFRNSYFHADCHFIVVYIGNVSFHFFNSVVVDTFFIKWQFTKVDFTIGSIGHSLVGIGITRSVSSQSKAKVTSVQRSIWKRFIEFKIYFHWRWCKGIVELCICTCRCISICIHTICWWIWWSCWNQSMAWLSNSHCHFCFHLVIGHSSFWRCWDNFFYSVVKGLTWIPLSWSICSKITSTILNTCEFHIASCIISCSCYLCAWFVIQFECEFIRFQIATFQFLREVKLYIYWWNNVVIECLVIRTSWFTTCWSHLCFGS